jgi:D-sedoheptulose 7-phosphate isomerase
MTSKSNSIENDFLELANLFVESSRALMECTNSAAVALTDCLRAGGKILICGNGGSAADSQHLAAEFVSSFMMGLGRRALPAIALTTDSSILTAFANDFGFEGVFARQVEALGKPGDILIAISTSGNSANVVTAAHKAKEIGLTVLALTGEGGGRLAEEADIAISVPSTNTQNIQTVHLAIEHYFCSYTEAEIKEGRL